MMIENTPEGFRLSGLVDNHLVSRHYIGYPLRDAVKMFREEFPKLDEEDEPEPYSHRCPECGKRLTSEDDCGHDCEVQ